MSSAPVFRRYGGSLQLSIQNFSDVLGALNLSHALWVATACPIEGLSCDARFLAAVDTDANGRIRVEELTNAIQWLASQLKDHSGIDSASDVLVLDHLSTAGQPLRRTAEMILSSLGAADRTRLSLTQLAESDGALRKAHANGDGIIAPEAVASEEAASTLRTVLAHVSPRTNRSGAAGVDLEQLQAFRARRAAALAHLSGKEAVYVWGADSEARAALILAVKPRLDEYFLQCRLVAAQPEAAARFRLTPEKVDTLLGDSAALARWAGALPVAPVVAGGRLRWAEVFQGADFEALETFRQGVCVPVLGNGGELSEGDYRSLVARAEAIRAWQAVVAGESLFTLGPALHDISDTQLDAIAALCQADLERKPMLDSIGELEKLLLYQRWMLRFCNNFISMPDVYDPRKDALYEKGNLILSGRLFTLSILVPDRGAHLTVAEKGSMFLAYVKVESANPPRSFEVAVPVTAGDSSGIEVGKRGIYIDLAGHEYDATVVHIVRQPVSLWEAMVSPFSRIRDFISSKVSTLTAGSEAVLEQRLKEAEAAATTAAAAPAPAPAPGGGMGAMGGLIAAGGVALAAVGSTLAFVMSQLKALTFLEMLKGVISIVLLVMIPSGILGYLKLRKRSISVLLEGAGWALNDTMLLTVSTGRLFTRRPRLPRGASVDTSDMVKSALALNIANADEQDDEGNGLWVFFAVLAAVIGVGVVFHQELLEFAGLTTPVPNTAPIDISPAPAAP